METAELRTLYDDQIKTFGRVVMSFELYDRRVLVPRSRLVEAIREEANIEISLEQIDTMASAGLFTWLYNTEGDDGEPGIPLYIVTRISLFIQLERRGWPCEELRDFAEWEEWLVDDCLADGLSYEDDDIAVIIRRFRFDLDGIQNEIWGRCPDKQPPGWSQTSWSSKLAELSLDELQQKRDKLQSSIYSLEHTKVQKEETLRPTLARTAFCLRWWEEMVRVVTIDQDRQRLEAGFSQAIRFTGEHKIAPDLDKLEDFGYVDWASSLEFWRFLNEPDQYAFRLPGMSLTGGTITLNEAMSPEEYARRFELFRLNDYTQHYKKAICNRRCAHCKKMLARSASERRRYCSNECSQAARQKAYRHRQKQEIISRVKVENISHAVRNQS